MICELTASDRQRFLLDEATAAAEAMAMAHAVSRRSPTCWRWRRVHPQTRACWQPGQSRSDDLWMSRRAISRRFRAARPFALVLQYPGTTGAMRALSAESTRRMTRTRWRSLRRICWRSRCCAARRDGRRHRGRLGPAFRRADGVWRPACRLLRHARRVQAAHAGPAGRRVSRMPTARRRCGWRCRRASNTYGARRRRPISARRRCCWR